MIRTTLVRALRIGVYPMIEVVGFAVFLLFAGTACAGDTTQELLVRGTWNALPMMTEMSRAFSRSDKAVHTAFIPGDTVQMPYFLSHHECDVALTQDVLLRAEHKEQLTKYEATLMGRMTFVIAVNKRNRLDSLSLKQVEDVFRGNVTEWKDLESSQLTGPIEVYGLSPRTAAGQLFKSLVRGRMRLAPSLESLDPQETHAKPRSDSVLSAVANHANAIGSLVRAVALPSSTHSPGLSAAGTVKPQCEPALRASNAKQPRPITTGAARTLRTAAARIRTTCVYRGCGNPCANRLPACFFLVLPTAVQRPMRSMSYARKCAALLSRVTEARRIGGLCSRQSLSKPPTS